MIRMFARRRWEVDIAAGTDRVMFGISLPSESRLNSVRAEAKGAAPVAIPVDTALLNMIEGYIIPVLDPDAQTSHQDLWDALVPKDTDVQVMDLDTAALDTTPFYEPGEMDWTQIFDVGLKPERIWGKEMFQHAADSRSYFHLETGPVDKWVPFINETIRVSKRYAVSQPSVVLFAFANPSLDDTTQTEPLQLEENEWAQIRYIEEVLDRALMHVLGLFEATAETPWEEASALLQKYLEPNVFEEDGGSWTAFVWRIFGRAIFDVSVQGRLGKVTLTSGR